MTATVLDETTAMLGIKPVKSTLDLAPQIQKGLPFSSLARVSKHLNITASLMNSALGMANRTAARRAQEKKLSPVESERLVRLTRVLAEAKHVLGSEEKARRWLLKPSRAFGGMIPIRMLITDIGATFVFEELGRIEHGVFG
jgi:putative toxin-antitoxin system antitoxin component (TIGR02293 family)